jgi:branched-chain amino acid transport system ATP-binding protein
MTADSRPIPSLIEVSALSASYGHIAALKPVSLHVEEGEFVTILGPNGAGKTTLLRAISRLIVSSGRVRFKGRDITALPTHQLARLGIIMVQEGRGLFGEMTVRENLLLGAYGLGGAGTEVERRLDGIFRLFPNLRERTDQAAASMSGGEQQMLAVGRALMAGPKLLMLDEPSLGLAPPGGG